MAKDSEYGTKMRLLHILISVMDNPNGYTKNYLAERHGVSASGLANFILGFHHNYIEVIGPDALLDHLRAQVKKMNF